MDPRNGRCRNRFQTPNTLMHSPLGHYTGYWIAFSFGVKDFNRAGGRLCRGAGGFVLPQTAEADI